MASISKKVIGASFLLPDEIVVEILSKVMDLKTLCICKRVSRSFYHNARQVDAISYIALYSWETDNSEFCEDIYSFAVNCYTRTRRRFIYLDGGLIDSMTKFTRLKSLYIELPLKSSFKDLPFLRWKWKVFIDSNRINSFVILSPTSIHDTKGSSYDDHEKEEPSFWSSCHIGIAWMYLEDAFVRYMMLFGFARECPFLEKISIMDRCKRGRIFLSGAKLLEARKSSTIPPKVYEFRHKVSRCRILFLDLPVSGLVLKGVELTIYEDVHLPSGYSYDGYIIIDDDEDDEEEAAYSEAVREIFKKHRDKISFWGW